MKIIKEKGSGKAKLVVYTKEYSSWAEKVYDLYNDESRIVLIDVGSITEDNWELEYNNFYELLVNNKLKQGAIISFGQACTLVQNLALKEYKIARPLILVDPTTRGNPSRFSKIIDKIESKLPLGLPLRLKMKGFDSRPYLQRIRFPINLVLSSKCNAYQRSEVKEFLGRAPTVFLKDLSESSEFERDLFQEINDFLLVPLKCSQKNKNKKIKKDVDKKPL